jgi:glycosyltransferase involved in cell wall biosynthesis
LIVCCYNSEERLSQTLRHLSAQVVPLGFRWEIVLVDNASTDSTSVSAKSIWTELGFVAPMSIVHEPKAGLAHARKAGVLQSRYDTIIFCDDDNWLDKDYVVNATTIMHENPSVGVAGGSHTPAWEGAAQFPCWFFSCADMYAVGIQGENSGDITKRGYLWGAGMVIRASLLRNLYANGIEPLLLGRSSKVLLSGDDSEICNWYLLAGFRLWYDTRLQLTHFIPSNRQTLEYVSGLRKGFAAAEPILRVYQLLIKRRNARKEFLRRPLIWLRSELYCWRQERHLFVNLGKILRHISLASAPTQARSR